MTEKYDDIINLPRHVSTRPPCQLLIERHSFTFAALSGHYDAVEETARLTREGGIKPGHEGGFKP